MPNIKKHQDFSREVTLSSFVCSTFCVCAHHLSLYLHFCLNWVIFKINYRLKDNLVIFVSKFRRYRKVFFIKCGLFLLSVCFLSLLSVLFLHTFLIFCCSRQYLLLDKPCFHPFAQTCQVGYLLVFSVSLAFDVSYER